MNDYRAYLECDYNSIYHHGVKGQRWGHRRYQNEDGSLTSAGRARYLKPSSSDSAVTRRVKEDYNNLSDQDFKNKYKTSKNVYAKRVNKYGDPYKHRINSKSYKMTKKIANTKYAKWLTKGSPKDIAKKSAVVGLAGAAAGLGIYALASHVSSGKNFARALAGSSGYRNGASFLNNGKVGWREVSDLGRDACELMIRR